MGAVHGGAGAETKLLSLDAVCLPKSSVSMAARWWIQERGADKEVIIDQIAICTPVQPLILPVCTQPALDSPP